MKNFEERVFKKTYMVANTVVLQDDFLRVRAALPSVTKVTIIFYLVKTTKIEILSKSLRFSL